MSVSSSISLLNMAQSFSSAQIGNLRLIDARALITVPRIRSSDYLELLKSKLPSLLTTAPGSVYDPTLPSLRHLIIFNNTRGGNEHAPYPDITAAMDFRDLLVYDDAISDASLARTTKTLDEHDVMNLQFTRFVL